MAKKTCAEYKRDQRNRPDGYAKSRQLDWKYRGIKNATYTRYLELIVEQNSECAICHTDINTSSPLDHNHETGEIRAVLCLKCNFLVGQVENNRIEEVQRVLAYLKGKGEN